MARQKGSLRGRCQGCNYPERVRIERFLAAGASIKGAVRKFSIDTAHCAVAEARATYVAAAGATKDQLEEKGALARQPGENVDHRGKRPTRRVCR
jgi:hypothetical protein